MLSKIWKSKLIKLKTKMRIFNSSVKSVLLYSSGTWRITKQLNIQWIIVLCTGMRLTVRTGTRNRFSVRFFDKWKTGTRTVSNTKIDDNTEPRLQYISSSCLAGNNHALPQHPPNPAHLLSFFGEFISIDITPPIIRQSLILIWVQIHGVRLRWLAEKCTC